MGMGRLKIVCGAALIVGLGMLAVAQDDAPRPIGESPAAKKPPVAPPANPAEMQKAMEEYRKTNAPGPEHELLKKLVGEWKIATKIFPGPGAPPIEAKGEAEAESAYDGRFVEMEVKGQIMGQPWDGSYVFGFDRFKKQYSLAIWTNVSTTLTTGLGSVDAAGSVLTYNVHMDDAQGARDTKFVIRFNADASHVLEAYDTVPGLGEIKVLESVFTKDD